MRLSSPIETTHYIKDLERAMEPRLRDYRPASRRSGFKLASATRLGAILLPLAALTLLMV